MRPVAWLLVLAALVVAAEPDGAVAPAARWSGPRGPASGSLASRATPVVDDVEEAWHLECEKIYAPPVHWEGRGYVAAEYHGNTALVAFDLRSGEVIARKSLPGAPDALNVWNHTVYCQVIDGQINAYRLRGKIFVSPWKYRGRRMQDKDRRPHRPIVHDNEVYCISGAHVVRLRPPAQFPVWAQEDWSREGPRQIVGVPVVYGPTLFVVSHEMDTLGLLQFNRSNGASVYQPIARTTPYETGDEPQITVTPGMIYVRTPWPIPTKRGFGHYALVPCVWEKGIAHPKAGGVYVADFVVPPAATRLGTLCLSGEPGGLEWQLRLPDGKYFVLATEKTQPYLFRDRVAPTILGDIAYCGSWAVDLATRELLWKLPVDRVTYPAVPADRLVLIVESGKTLRAFRGRGKR